MDGMSSRFYVDCDVFHILHYLMVLFKIRNSLVSILCIINDPLLWLIKHSNWIYRTCKNRPGRTAYDLFSGGKNRYFPPQGLLSL